jgi:hypothetical protein
LRLPRRSSTILATGDSIASISILALIELRNASARGNPFRRKSDGRQCPFALQRSPVQPGV